MKEIKVGIIGSGFIAGVHCDAIDSLEGTRVTAHCDTDRENREQLSRSQEHAR